MSTCAPATSRIARKSSVSAVAAGASALKYTRTSCVATPAMLVRVHERRRTGVLVKSATSTTESTSALGILAGSKRTQTPATGPGGADAVPARVVSPTTVAVSVACRNALATSSVTRAAVSFSTALGARTTVTANGGVCRRPTRANTPVCRTAPVNSVPGAEIAPVIESITMPLAGLVSA